MKPLTFIYKLLQLFCIVGVIVSILYFCTTLFTLGQIGQPILLGFGGTILLFLLLLLVDATEVR